MKNGIDEYLKRLSPFASIEVVELSDTSIKTAVTPDSVKEKEAVSILKKIEKDDYVILMDENGKQKNSLEFADFLFSISEVKKVVFVIGGVYGVSPAVKERADTMIALSRLTFTHRMARLILCEQLYRAMMIKANRSYHL